MNKLTRLRDSGIAIFDPKLAAQRDAQADAVIDYAKRVKDWPTLEEAIGIKLADQEAFIKWWREIVRRAGGKEAQAIRAERGELLPEADAEKSTGIKHQQVSRWSKRLKDPAAYKAMLYGKEYKAAMAAAGENHIATNSGENEWYTPPEFIESARRAMGGIDVDPATSEAANESIGAATFYTISDNGLKQKWFGRVWMNPPYGQPLIAEFCAAVVRKKAACEIEQACVLVNNATETVWFQTLLSQSSALCFPCRRIKFLDEDSNPVNSPLQGQAIIYMGSRAAEFCVEFSAHGFSFEVIR